MTLSTNLDLTVLNEVDGFPKFTRTIGGWTCTRKFICFWTSVFEVGVLPEKDDRIEAPEGETLALKDLKIDRKNSHAEIIATYSSPERVSLGGFPDRDDGIPEYSVDDNTIEKSIEEHENHKTKWNYDFLVKNEAVFVVQDWENRTDTILTNDESKKYKWQKPSIPVETGWWKAREATKPKIENFLTSAPVIQETIYFKKLRQLIAKADFRTAVIKKPDTPFADKIGGKFLIVSLSISFDGDWWGINRSYQFADKWDPEIYDEVT